MAAAAAAGVEAGAVKAAAQVQPVWQRGDSCRLLGHVVSCWPDDVIIIVHAQLLLLEQQHLVLTLLTLQLSPGKLQYCTYNNQRLDF